MNTRMRIATLLLVAVSVGCTSENSAAEKKVEAAEAQLAVTKKEAKAKEAAMEVAVKKKIEAAEAEVVAARKVAKAAAEELEDYGFERRGEYIGRVRRELTDLEIELNQLGRSGSAKADSQGRIAEVRARWTTAKQKLDAADQATEANWNDTKAAIKTSRNELRDSFASTRQWLSDQIEP